MPGQICFKPQPRQLLVRRAAAFERQQLKTVRPVNKTLEISQRDAARASEPPQPRKRYPPMQFARTQLNRVVAGIYPEPPDREHYRDRQNATKNQTQPEERWIVSDHYAQQESGEHRRQAGKYEGLENGRDSGNNSVQKMQAFGKRKRSLVAQSGILFKPPWPTAEKTCWRVRS